MEQYNDPKQVDILSESSNILAPQKNLYVRPAFFSLIGSFVYIMGIL